MDATQAAELLAAANSAGEGAPAGQPETVAPAAPAATPNNQPGATPPASQGQPEGTTEPDSFTSRFDPNSLPAELVPVYRSMQGDYTRKQQEIAAQRSALEGLDPVEARQALDFVQALNSDPQYALQVHSELSNALQSMGLTPAQANQAASEQLSAGEDDGEYGSVPPEILQRLERQEQQMQEWQAQQQQANFEAELTRQEMAIRQSHPEWDDQDINSVYAYAYQYGGDLNKASQAYVDEQARWATRFLSQKQSVPAGSPASTAHGQTPPAPFKSLDEATNAAEEAFRASFGA